MEFIGAAERARGHRVGHVVAWKWSSWKRVGPGFAFLESVAAAREQKAMFPSGEFVAEQLAKAECAVTGTAHSGLFGA